MWQGYSLKMEARTDAGHSSPGYIDPFSCFLAVLPEKLLMRVPLSLSIIVFVVSGCSQVGDQEPAA